MFFWEHDLLYNSTTVELIYRTSGLRLLISEKRSILLFHLGERWEIEISQTQSKFLIGLNDDTMNLYHADSIFVIFLVSNNSNEY